MTNEDNGVKSNQSPLMTRKYTLIEGAYERSENGVRKVYHPGDPINLSKLEFDRMKAAQRIQPHDVYMRSKLPVESVEDDDENIVLGDGKTLGNSELQTKARMLEESSSLAEGMGDDWESGEDDYDSTNNSASATTESTWTYEDILSQPMAAIRNVVGGVDDKADLDGLIETEKNGKNRAAVIRLLTDRLAANS